MTDDDTLKRPRLEQQQPKPGERPHQRKLPQHKQWPEPNTDDYAADDGRAITTIEAVQGDALVDEICRMLGAAPADAAARSHAHELLARRAG